MKLSLLSIALVLTFAASACGPASFVVTPQVNSQKAPGHFVISPKVDILFAQDDTGSMTAAYASLSTQIPTFLNNLQARGWDYHFATAPLTQDQALTHIIASTQDSNWGALWTPPYPGALANGPGTLPSSIFTFPSQFNPYITQNNSLSGLEPGLDNITRALETRATGTGLIRNDALLVVIAMSNGNDTSNTKFCDRGDGYFIPCEQLGANFQASAICGTPGAPVATCGTTTSSYNNYKSRMIAVKGSAAQIRFFSTVSYGENNCQGAARTLNGARYQQMAADLGGASYDICNQSISSALDGIASNLQVTKIAYRTRFLIMSGEPNVDTITVTKYLGGTTPQLIARDQSHFDGWDYVGYQSNLYQIDAPVPMNLVSGYAIELYGSAKLLGDDSADVSWKPAGAVDSSTH